MKWSRVFYVVLILLVGLLLVMQFVSGRERAEIISLTELAEFAKQNRIESIVVNEDDLEITLFGGAGDGVTRLSRKEPGVGIGETLQNLGVPEESIRNISITVNPPSRWGGWINILATLLP
jgi:hypothetical protein